MTNISFPVFIYFLCSLVLASRDVSSAANPECEDGPKGGIDWIIHVREPNHGWKEHTHRANIALAVHKWKGTETEMRKMELQLELEITKMLLRSSKTTIPENDLALYIHALIATNKNPRNFHGIDLVADLLHRVNGVRNSAVQVHPFLVLTLCNSGAVEFSHLQKIRGLALHKGTETRQQIEMKALALKALSCAASNPELDKFQSAIDAAAQFLISKQNIDGSFGNAYTTSLAVQALIASGTGENWNKRKALDYLERESVVNVNIIKAYFIVLAQEAQEVKFIKDLYSKGPKEPELKIPVDTHFVQYSVRAERDIYYSITLKVPVQWNFFQIMEFCSILNNKFNFTHYSDEQNMPVVYSVSGIPNDAEENKFWTLCIQHRNGNRDNSRVNAGVFQQSPIAYFPRSDDHATFVYGDANCST